MRVLCTAFAVERYLPPAKKPISQRNGMITPPTARLDPRPHFTLSEGLVESGISPFSHVSLSLRIPGTDRSISVQGIGVTEISRRLTHDDKMRHFIEVEGLQEFLLPIKEVPEDNQKKKKRPQKLPVPLVKGEEHLLNNHNLQLSASLPA